MGADRKAMLGTGDNLDFMLGILLALKNDLHLLDVGPLYLQVLHADRPGNGNLDGVDVVWDLNEVRVRDECGIDERFRGGREGLG